MPFQTHDGVPARWGTIILGVFQKESSGNVCGCTRCEILQLWITSGHHKHHIGILDTFSAPSTSSVLRNHEQVVLPLSGWASFAVP